MAELPSGTLTFLFTDLEGSTALWEAEPEIMRDCVARHDELLAGCVEAVHGMVVKTTGDGLVAVFATASDGVAGALACQQVLSNEEWLLPIRARMGLYTGEAQPVDGDYHAPVLNRAARVMSAGHGGQVLVAESTASLVRDVVDLEELGTHRLRDLGEPQRLFQLGGGDFPLLRTLDTLPGNLPSALDSFVGRTEEVSRVVEELGGHRLVTLSGVGGAGKTRLALQVAAELLPDYEHGAWLVELGAVRDPGGVPAAIAAGLGIVQRDGERPLDTVLARTANQTRLVVVDNCEHLLDAAAQAVEALLAGCPGLRFLATSREGLGLRGEYVWPVPSLRESVDLFCDRARELAPDFVPTADDLAVIEDLCDQLDGMPLAIELAAGRTRSMTPAQIAQHLDQRFRLLRGGRRRAERHQTLREAITWSYDLLDPTEQAVFCRLGVFVAGFDLAAAQAVAAGETVDDFEVLDRLDALVSKSLVEANASAGSMRYRLLETLRQYAVERLIDAGEDTATRDRHAAWALDQAVIHDATVRGAQQRAGVDAMFAIYPEVGAAFDWFVERNEIDAAIGLAQHCLAYWFSRCPDEGVRRCRQVINKSAAVAPQARANILATGCFVALLGDIDACVAWGREALDFVDSNGLQFPPPLANLAPFTEDPLAGELVDRAIESSRQLGSRWWEASNLLCRNNVDLRHPGTRHVDRTAEALVVANEVGMPMFVASANEDRADALLPFDLEQALSCADTAIALGRAGPSPTSVAMGLASTIYGLMLGGEHDRAIERLTELIEYHDAPPVLWAACLAYSAARVLAETDPLQAAELLSAAGALWPSPGWETRFIYTETRDTLQKLLDNQSLQAAEHRGADLTVDDVRDITIQLITRAAKAE